MAACAERIGGEITVMSRSDEVIATSAPRTPEQQIPAQEAGAEVVAALGGQNATDVRTSVIGGVQYLSVAVPVGHASPPAAVVRIVMSTEKVHSRVHQMWTVLGIAGLLVLITTALVALGIARWAGQPLRRLEQATAQFAAGRLTGPVTVTEGPGMNRDQRHRAFDRFWRAPGAPKGGTGLGLALVQRLIHAGGGDISLHEAPSDGLGVRVSLAYAEAVPEPATGTAWDRHAVG